MHIPVVLGTARAERRSEQVAHAVTKLIGELEGVSAELVDVKDHVTQAVTTPSWGSGGSDSQPTKWREILEKSNALILVIPEYNHGYPGELKILLDSEYERYKNKPVGLVGVSRGMLGGARVIDHIKPVLIEMHLHPIRESVTFLKVDEALNDDGSLANEKTAKAITNMGNELTALAQKLQQ